jgi:hypothetical protein
MCVGAEYWANVRRVVLITILALYELDVSGRIV